MNPSSNSSSSSSKAPAASRSKGTVAPAPTAGESRERPAGALAVWALVACNLASLAFFLRSFIDDRRRRGGAAARSGSDDGSAQPPPPPPVEDEAMIQPPPEHYVAPDAVLNLELGDPMMYEAFWRAVGPRATTVIPGGQTMSYFSDDDDDSSGNNADNAGGKKLCWFLEPGFEAEVRRLHRVVGNAVADAGRYHLVVGNGATQLFQAAMYALSCDAGAQHKPVPVVAAAPYYSSYPPQTDLQRSGHFRWAGDATAFATGAGADNYTIELVCSPNNPDGTVRESVLNSCSGKPNNKATIHDLVYYWPQYTAITARAAHDVMLFTLSKITGHAGTRLGWALVRDRDVARKMVYFVDRSTIGVSKESQLRGATILGVVSDAYEQGGSVPRLFDFARQRLEERWDAMRAAVAKSGAFSVQEETSEYCNFTKQTVTACPAFAWLRCEKEGVEDCAAFLAELNIVARGGEQFGGDARCVRVNMLDRDQVFDLLVQRIASLKVEQHDDSVDA